MAFRDPSEETKSGPCRLLQASGRQFARGRQALRRFGGACILASTPRRMASRSTRGNEYVKARWTTH